MAPILDLTLDKDHVYRWGDRIVPGISEVIKSAGLVDDRWFTEYSRDRGSAVHAACHFYDENDLDETTLDPVVVPYLEAWKKFREESGFKPTILEKSLYSVTYGFAGTPDRGGILNKDESVVEIKSGLISAVTGLQLAAQEILLAESEDFHAKKRFAVQLKPDGQYKLTRYASLLDAPTFLASLTVHKFKAANGIIKTGGGNNGNERAGIPGGSAGHGIAETERVLSA